MKEERAALIVRGVLSLARRLRSERPRDSPGVSALSILSTLHRLGPMPAARLAEEERLQPQSLTRIILSLEEKGWIARTRSKEDRRAISIALTRKGLGALAADIKARRAWLESAMAERLTKAERDALLKATGAMLKLAGYDASSLKP